MSKAERPMIQGPYDGHPEVPFTSSELDIADSDKSAAEVRQREAEFKRLRAEPQTPEERAYRLEQLHRLTKRYGGNKAA